MIYPSGIFFHWSVFQKKHGGGERGERLRVDAKQKAFSRICVKIGADAMETIRKLTEKLEIKIGITWKTNRI